MDNYLNSDYFYDKCIWMIAFCGNPRKEVSKLFNKYGLNSIRMYNVLSNFLTFNVYFLDDVAKNNLCFLIKFLRNGSNDKEKFDKLENSLRDDGLDCTVGFILTQFERRLGESSPSDIYDKLNDEDKKQKYFNYLKSLIINDVDVLISHSDIYDNETFRSIKVPEILRDMNSYIRSVNMIISEKPEILGDPRFVNRVKTVCSVYDSMEKSHNEIVEKTYTMFKSNL